MMLPTDLRLIVFDMEHEMGVDIGGGELFIRKEGRGRSLTNEASYVRLVALYIGSKYLNYGSTMLADRFQVDKSMVNYAKKSVSNDVLYNTTARRKIYNISIQNGLVDLANEIREIEVEREKAKKAFKADNTFR
jgi:hypothetical protein